MSRTKQSRTAGNSEPGYTGKRKETSSQSQEARDRKRKAKLKGNKAGGRNAIESKQKQKQNAQQAINNKRVGSTKAVPLTIEEKIQHKQPKVVLQPRAKVIKSNVETKLSPEKELDQIENNERLNDLLEQLDNDQEISQIDNDWVEKQMSRHQTLMKELGWLDNDGEEGEENLLQQFEDASSALDEFK